MANNVASKEFKTKLDHLDKTSLSDVHLQKHDNKIVGIDLNLERMQAINVGDELWKSIGDEY